jgi:hypothetical protein
MIRDFDHRRFLGFFGTFGGLLGGRYLLFRPIITSGGSFLSTGGLLVAVPTCIGYVGQGIEDFLVRDKFALSSDVDFAALWQLCVRARIDETLARKKEGFQVSTFGVLGADDEEA